MEWFNICELYDTSLIWLNLKVLSYVGYLSMCRSKGLDFKPFGQTKKFSFLMTLICSTLVEYHRVAGWGDLAVLNVSLYQFEATCKSLYSFTIADYKDVTLWTCL